MACALTVVCRMNEDYLVRNSDQNDNRVEAWSIKRLPFEPKGWLQQFRRDLQEAVRGLVVAPEQVLHGVYQSEARDLCDAENALFYNVGSGPFARAARRGLRFERAYAPPPHSTEVPGARHYYQYRAAEQVDEFGFWERGRTLAEWESATFATLGALADLATVWHHIHQGHARLDMMRPTDSTSFGIAAILHAPIGKVPRLANLVKGTFDGVVSAFHVHDGSAIAEVSRRLARQMALTPDEIADRLIDHRRSVLGQRNLVRPRTPDSVHWYPGDDLCVAGELRTEPSATTSNWQLTGAIFEVRPRFISS